MRWADPVWGGRFFPAIVLVSSLIWLAALELKATVARYAVLRARLPVLVASRDLDPGSSPRPPKKPRTADGLQVCVESCTASHLTAAPREFPVESIVKGYSSSQYWFPTGFDSFDAIIEHELRNVPKITKAMVDRAWCIGPDPFQGIVNWQMAGGALLRESKRIGDTFENRVRNGLALLHKALGLNSSRSGDVDMVLYWADIPPDLERGRTNRDKNCHDIHPFFVYQKQEAPSNPSSMVFPDPGFVNWPQGRRNILAIAKSLGWGDKRNQLLFRGNDAGYRKALDMRTLATEHPKLFDLYKVDVNDVRGRMSREEQCSFKYLLYMPGFWGTLSTRLRWLLACGSVVVVPKHDWYEFFYPLLKPYEHFIPAGNMRLTRGHDLPCILKCLETHDEAARRVAENGLRFVDEVLTEDVAERFISRLFSVYSQHMAYNATSFALRNPSKCTCPKPEPGRS